MKSGPNPYGVPWELVIGTAFGLFAVLLFLWRRFQSVSSRLYAGRLRKLALKLPGLTEEKCERLEKVSLVQKEHEGLESKSLEGGSFEKASTEAQKLEATYEQLHRSKANRGDEILCLEEELKEQKARHSKQDEMMADISKRIKRLEDESKSLRSEIAEATTTFRICQMNEEGLELAIKEALNGDSNLEQSQKSILQQEAEEWKEEAGENITVEDSQVHVEQVLSDKENHVQSLTEALLKRKDRSSPRTGAQTHDGNVALEMKRESGSGAHVDDEPQAALKKLVDAATLKASLETLEGERNEICTSLSEVEKTKEDLLEQSKSLRMELASLESENTQLESETRDLQQKYKFLMEQYPENIMKLYRELRVEEESRVEQEEELSKVEEKISHMTEELETCRKRATYLKEELERTTRSYQGQIISSEKKAHHSVLAAQIAERNLSYLINQNSRLRQKCTEKELKCNLLEKDPCSLDDSNTAFGRKHSPNGSVFPPFPPVRGAWFPVDPRSQVMSRGPSFPPPPPGNMYGAPRDYFPLGPPPLPFPMRDVCSPRWFPHYLTPRAGFPSPPTPAF